MNATEEVLEAAARIPPRDAGELRAFVVEQLRLLDEPAEPERPSNVVSINSLTRGCRRGARVLRVVRSAGEGPDAA